MSFVRGAVLGVLLAVVGGVGALAAPIGPVGTPVGSYVSVFQRTTNDGVYALNAAQAAALGLEGATKLGLLRVRPGNGVSWSAGDFFDEQTLDRTRRNGSVFGYLNGPLAPDFVPQAFNGETILYDGDVFEALGTTVFQQASDPGQRLVAAVAFGFTGTVTFNGVSTFSGVTLGDAPIAVPPPVPLPAAGWLLLVGLGGLAFLQRRTQALG